MTGRSRGRSALLCLLGAGLGLSVASPAPAAPPADPPGPPSVHSSDGVTGPTAEPVPASRRLEGEPTNVWSYRVVPGVRFRRWDQTDPRGTFRAYLLRVNLATPGLSLQYVAPPTVAARDELTDLLAQESAVAGINGDFFDIGDTGAPLGVGVDESAILHGPRRGWITSFVLTGTAEAARADVQQTPVTATVPSRPRLSVTNLNSPTIDANGIGVYTPRWGSSPGYAVTDGARRRDLRQVVIRGGRVVSSSARLSAGRPIRGSLLIGRGDGARQLRRLLPVGARAEVRLGAAHRPLLAVSGSTQLVDGGEIVVRDDKQLHPRTAVGVDTDTGRVLMLVVDGRQDHSRGLTLRELALLMRDLGAEEALNLDGGGSSTMVTTRPSGRVRVANRPSDGKQRPVPNGLQLLYAAPPSGP